MAKKALMMCVKPSILMNAPYTEYIEEDRPYVVTMTPQSTRFKETGLVKVFKENLDTDLKDADFLVLWKEAKGDGKKPVETEKVIDAFLAKIKAEATSRKAKAEQDLA